MCITRKLYEDKGVQLFSNKVIRSRSLRERLKKFPMSIILCIGVRSGWSGRAAGPLALKISGQTLFSGQAQVAQKSRMVQNISVPRKISGHTLFFRASASCSISLNVKSIFSTAKNFRASANCSKILNVKSRLYSIQPKILGQTLLFGQEQVAQKS